MSTCANPGVDVGQVSTCANPGVDVGQVSTCVNPGVDVGQVSIIICRGGSRKLIWVVLLWAWLPHPQNPSRVVSRVKWRGDQL